MLNLNDPLIIALIIIAASILVTFLVYFMVPFVVKKKFPIETYLKTSNELIEGAATILRAIDTDPTSLSIPEKIVLFADIAVDNAQYLYDLGKINDEEKREKAIDFVENALKEAGIELTDVRKELIEGAVNASIRLLEIMDIDDNE